MRLDIFDDMVAKSATRLACVSAVRSVPTEIDSEESSSVANAGVEFTRGLIIASGMSLVLWGSLIGAITRFIR